MKIHFYGQPDYVDLPKNTTVEDLKSLTFFNKIIKNYAKLLKIESYDTGRSTSI